MCAACCFSGLNEEDAALPRRDMRPAILLGGWDVCSEREGWVTSRARKVDGLY